MQAAVTVTPQPLQLSSVKVRLWEVSILYQQRAVPVGCTIFTASADAHLKMQLH